MSVTFAAWLMGEIAGINSYTMLLEICDWDEEKVESISKVIEGCLVDYEYAGKNALLKRLESFTHHLIPENKGPAFQEFLKNTIDNSLQDVIKENLNPQWEN